MEKRLSGRSYRDQLEFRILVSLRNTVTVEAVRNDERFASLDRRNKGIIEAILDYNN